MSLRKALLAFVDAIGAPTHPQVGLFIHMNTQAGLSDRGLLVSSVLP